MRSMVRARRFLRFFDASRRHGRAHSRVPPSAAMQEPAGMSIMAASRMIGLPATTAISGEVLAHAHTNVFCEY
jgi:hypothetical protein